MAKVIGDDEEEPERTCPKCGGEAGMANSYSKEWKGAKHIWTCCMCLNDWPRTTLREYEVYMDAEDADG